MFKFTGERIVPGADNCESNLAQKMYQEHVARYYFASQFTENKEVLDVGCGVGYGSMIMATKGAKFVEAFDLSDETIEYAKTHYAHNLINYTSSNAESFKYNKKFDLITCFELIEHVEKQEDIAKNIHNHLKENGLVVISTPRKLEKKRTDFHTREFTFQSFNELLKKYFKHLYFFFENNHFISYITDSHPNTRKTDTEVLKDVFNLNKCDYFICIASQKEINTEAIKNSLIINDESYMKRLEADVQIQETALKNSKADFREQEAALKNSKADFQRQEGALIDSQRIIKLQDQQIVSLEDNVMTSKKQLDNISNSLRQKDEQIENINNSLRQKNEQIENINNSLRQKNEQVGNITTSLHNVRSTLNLIYNSQGWKFLLQYYRLRDNLLPENSAIRENAKKILNKLRGKTHKPYPVIKATTNKTKQAVIKKAKIFPQLSRTVKTKNTKKLRVLLINPPFHRLHGLHDSFFPIGLGYIASVLDKDGFHVRIYNMENPIEKLPLSWSDQNLNRKLLDGYKSYVHALENSSHQVWQEVRDVIRNEKPDLVGISAKSPAYPGAKLIAQYFKEINPDGTIIIGGPHATLSPNEVMEDGLFDYLVRGEGEQTALELCNRIEQKKVVFDDIPGLSFKKDNKAIHNPPRKLIENIDEIPFPAKDLSLLTDRFEMGVSSHIVSTRGCPFRCGYCAQHKIWTRKVRFQSLERTLSEIAELQLIYGIDFVYFWNDSFTVNRKRIVELCNALIERNFSITWNCTTRVDLVDTELLELMYSAGCRAIDIGVETGSDRMMKLIDKSITLQKVTKAIEMIQNAGIQCNAFFMLGFPQETEEDIRMTLDFIRNIKATIIAFSIFTPYPGCALFETTKEMGLLPEKINWAELSHHSGKNYFCKNVTKDRFEELILEATALVDNHNHAATTPTPESARNIEATNDFVVYPASAKPHSGRINKISYLVGCFDGTSKQYRVYNLIEALTKKGIECNVFDESTGTSIEQMLDSDLLVIFRAAMSENTNTVIARFKERNIPVIFDVDDLVFEPESLQYVDAIKDWPEGKRAEYLDGVTRYRETLMECDYVTCPTDFLKKKINALGKKAFVIQNTFNSDQLELSKTLPENSNNSQKISIGYFSGTGTHNADFMEASNAIYKILNKYDNVELHIVGHLDLNNKMNSLNSKITRKAFMPHLDMLKYLSQIDINIAPLELNNPFTAGKSELKIFEAALLGVPTVASNTDSYGKCISDGINGLLASSEQEWLEKLTLLIEDKKLRAKMGAKAKEDFTERFYIGNAIDPAIKTYENILDEQQNNHSQKATKTIKMDIGWIVPEPFPGSGGHRMIFRTIKKLSEYGHDLSIYFLGGNSLKKTKEIVTQHFYDLSHVNFEKYSGTLNSHDVCFATHWSTVYPMMDNIERVKHPFYFVQDYEPLFSPMSSEYIMAENTYKMGLTHITAGPWLSKILKQKFNADTSFVRFPIERKVYNTGIARTKTNRNVLFFARPDMHRRCYSLGLLTLDILKQICPNVEIILFGSNNVDSSSVPFKHTNLGVLSINQLAELYRNADLGLVFSTTNPSVAPYEMMACELAVADLKLSDSVENYGHEDNVFLLNTLPEKMAQEIEDILNNDEKRKTRALNGYNYVMKNFPPDDEEMVRMIESLIKQKIDN